MVPQTITLEGELAGNIAGEYLGVLLKVLGIDDPRLVHGLMGCSSGA
jgi:hypothetical protein